MHFDDSLHLSRRSALVQAACMLLHSREIDGQALANKCLAHTEPQPQRLPLHLRPQPLDRAVTWLLHLEHTTQPCCYPSSITQVHQYAPQVSA